MLFLKFLYVIIYLCCTALNITYKFLVYIKIKIKYFKILEATFGGHGWRAMSSNTIRLFECSGWRSPNITWCVGLGTLDQLVGNGRLQPNPSRAWTSPTESGPVIATAKSNRTPTSTPSARSFGFADVHHKYHPNALL
jgi:hypothetical protein